MEDWEGNAITETSLFTGQQGRGLELSLEGRGMAGR